MPRASRDRWNLSNTSSLSSSGIPGPSSETVSSITASDTGRIRTVTVPPAGLHLAALSHTLSTARSIPAESPYEYQGVNSTSNSTSCRRRRTRSSARSTASDTATGSNSTSPESSRASSTRSPTNWLSSEICPMTSSSREFLSASGIDGAPGRLAAMSSSTLVRRLVRGVLSSCPASATRRACRSRLSPRATSIWLKLLVRRAISSSPATGMGRRSSVRAMRSTALVRRATGASPVRPTAVPATAASAIPAAPTRVSTIARRLRAALVGPRSCARMSVDPSRTPTA